MLFRTLLLFAVLSGCTIHGTGPLLGAPALRTSLGERNLHVLNDTPLGIAAGDFQPMDADSSKMRPALVASAAKFVGKSHVPGARADCSGTVRAIYQDAGIPLPTSDAKTAPSDVARLYELVRKNGVLHKGKPRPGDLVFFDRTYDRDRNGVVDDQLTHVGIVEKVTEDGTVIFIHHVGGGILRYRMNLAHPGLRRDPKTKVSFNHYLRRKRGRIPARTTGELFRSYGSLPIR